MTVMQGSQGQEVTLETLNVRLDEHGKRFDELGKRMESGFQLVDGEINELRVKAGFGRADHRFDRRQRELFWAWVVLVATLIGSPHF